MTLTQLLAAGVRQPNGCFTPGNGYKCNGSRYWNVTVDGRTAGAHVHVWESKHGPKPAGMEVCHTCDNGRCFEESHLWLGTHADNMHDCNAKGRRNPPRGERARGFVKLTDGQVLDMRSRNANGECYKSLAIRFSISYSAVEKIVRGVRWPHLPVFYSNSEQTHFDLAAK